MSFTRHPTEQPSRCWNGSHPATACCLRPIDCQRMLVLRCPISNPACTGQSDGHSCQAFTAGKRAAEHECREGCPCHGGASACELLHVAVKPPQRQHGQSIIVGVAVRFVAGEQCSGRVGRMVVVREVHLALHESHTRVAIPVVSALFDQLQMPPGLNMVTRDG